VQIAFIAMSGVRAASDDPFSKGRWTLIGLDVGLIVAGLVLATRPLAWG
jgi:hypothetical protein